ncbi:flagellar motor protein MotB [Comamonas terrigena]|uniref:flagellar motor protein MotB n=1 Tax=Comamonas terrigena TaxID=32013 RepID=UPI0023544463|nr:flagellar motor protein MotB [Comamonas terrigena]
MLKRAGQEHGEVVVKKSGGKHQHEEHNSAWKVAFADFCLALMCLFLVLWVLAARDKEEIEMAMAAGAAPNMTYQGQGVRMIGEYQPGLLIPKNPVRPQAQEETGGQPRVQKLLDSPEELAQLSRRVREVGEQVGLGDHIVTAVTAEGLRITVHDTEQSGMFKLGSAEPTAEFVRLLRRIGPMFREIDNQLVIAGHTDALPYSSHSAFAASNWSLSMQRALAARGHMMLGGMPERSVLQVIGMAEVAPADPEQPQAAINRRVELLVTTKAHAQNVHQTFGRLPVSEPLTPGLQSSPADTPMLELLRKVLLQPLQGEAQAKP